MKKTKRTVLIIDDNPDDLAFYSRILTQIHSEFVCEVHTAGDANEGLAAWQTHVFDCVLVDYNMPQINGLALLDLLQQERPGQQVPVVILTGEPHQRVQARAAQQGALNYVVKDTVNSQDQLLKVINQTIKWASSLNAAKVVTHG